MGKEDEWTQPVAELVFRYNVPPRTLLCTGRYSCLWTETVLAQTVLKRRPVVPQSGATEHQRQPPPAFFCTRGAVLRYRMLLCNVPYCDGVWASRTALPGRYGLGSVPIGAGTNRGGSTDSGAADRDAEEHGPRVRRLGPGAGGRDMRIYTCTCLCLGPGVQEARGTLLARGQLRTDSLARGAGRRPAEARTVPAPAAGGGEGRLE
eukprot:3878071-Rhodomonas_salina.1